MPCIARWRRWYSCELSASVTGRAIDSDVSSSRTVGMATATTTTDTVNELTQINLIAHPKLSQLFREPQDDRGKGGNNIECPVVHNYVPDHLSYS